MSIGLSICATPHSSINEWLDSSGNAVAMFGVWKVVVDDWYAQVGVEIWFGWLVAMIISVCIMMGPR